MILNIDIRDGLSDSIVIYKDDNRSIRESAIDFVRRNSLDEGTVIGPLVQQIEDTLQRSVHDYSIPNFVASPIGSVGTLQDTTFLGSIHPPNESLSKSNIF